MLRRSPPPAAPDFAATLRTGTNRERLGLILGRGDLTDAEDAALLAAAADELPGAVRLGLRHPEADVRAATAAFAGRAGLLAMGADVVALLADPADAARSAAVGASHALADRGDAVARGEAADEPGRRAFVAALAGGVRSGGPGLNRLCGWLAAAGDPADAELRAVLRHPTGGPALTRAFAVDRHPGTVRVLLGLLEDRRPPRAARVAAGRTDPAFLFALLRRVADGGPHAPPGLPALPWLAEPAAVLAGLPAPLQPAVAALADRPCEPPASRRAVRAWLLTRGGAAGRRAAEPALRELSASRRVDVLTAAAGDPDPAVAAWAVGRFAACRVSGWPRKLADFARHGEPAVREAATRALREAATSSR